VETIKERGLVFVADTPDEVGQPSRPAAAEWAYQMPEEGVNGVMKANGVLRFNDTTDMECLSISHRHLTFVIPGFWGPREEYVPRIISTDSSGIPF
jgi:hypothetical protein